MAAYYSVSTINPNTKEHRNYLVRNYGQALGIVRASLATWADAAQIMGVRPNNESVIEAYNEFGRISIGTFNSMIRPCVLVQITENHYTHTFQNLETVKEEGIFKKAWKWIKGLF